MRLIVFDLDHTLLKANSSFRFGSFLYRTHFFSFWTLLNCLTTYVRHKWLGLSVQALHLQSFDLLFKGCSLAVIDRYANQFLDESLASLLYEPVMQRLKIAQERGDSVLILSSSPDFLVGKIAHRLKVQQWQATTYQTDEERNLIAISHVMEGADKAYYVQMLAKQLSLSPSAITVYSDSHLDLPVLKMAGEVIGVMPDSHLKRLCMLKGWEIL